MTPEPLTLREREQIRVRIDTGEPNTTMRDAAHSTATPSDARSPSTAAGTPTALHQRKC